MMKRPEKEQMVEELGLLFEEAKNLFVTDYLGLNVAQVTEFRKNLRENNIKFRVAKNTLLSLAAKNKGYENLVDYFEGPPRLRLVLMIPQCRPRRFMIFTKSTASRKPRFS